jgi:hypothetical protein
MGNLPSIDQIVYVGENMIIGVKENISEPGHRKNPFTNTAVQDLGDFLALHFERLENFFSLMDRSQGNGDCRTCEFSSMGRLVLQRFKAEIGEVRTAIERDLGPIRIARGKNRNDGVIAVQPKGSGQQDGKV